MDNGARFENAIDILDSLIQAVVCLNQNLQVIYMNPAAENLLDTSRHKALGTNFRQLVGNENSWISKLEDVLQSQTSYTAWDIPLHIHNGVRRLSVDCSLAPVRCNNNLLIVLEFFTLARNHRISRDETLFSQHHASQTLLRQLAHEIKNPLSGLRGAAQLLDRELDQPALKEYTRVIIGEADRLTNLIDTLIGPRRPFDMVSTNIHMVLEHVSLLCEPDLGGINLIRDYDPSTPEIIADPQSLIQAFFNLLHNALVALQPQTDLGQESQLILRTRVQRQVTIGQQHHKLALRIDIIDNGPGVPLEIMDSIFYPMVTSRPDGMGLGLSIAQSVIMRHQGLIECDSKPGRTQFTVLLPFVNQELIRLSHDE